MTPEERAEYEAAGLLDPVDPNEPTCREMLEALIYDLRRYIADTN